MEFKGSEKEWKLIRGEYENTIISAKGFFVAKATNNYDALLISKSPQMLDELNETVTDLKILKGNILDALKTNHLFEGMPELIQKWIDRKELLIKQATEL